RCFRHSFSPPQSRGGASDHPGAAWQETADPARAARHSWTGLLGQRLPHYERQPAAAHAGGLSWTEATDPILEGSRAANARAWGNSAGDGFLRSVSGPADGGGRWNREFAVEHVHSEDTRSAKVRRAVEPRIPRISGHREQEILGRPAGRC